MKKTLSMLLAGAMLATALTGCGGSASSSSDSQNSGNSDSTASGTAFKIGGTGPLTGAAAIYGNAAKNGAQIAVDEINAEGGDIQFELNYQDDEHDAEKAVNAVIACIGDALASGDKIQIAGFGTFEVRERAAKTARNPRTGETIDVPACKVPAFKAGKGLKDKVAK